MRERRPGVAPERLYFAPHVVDTTALSPFTFALSPLSRFPFQEIFNGATRKGAQEWIFVLQ